MKFNVIDSKGKVIEEIEIDSSQSKTKDNAINILHIYNRFVRNKYRSGRER